MRPTQGKQGPAQHRITETQSEAKGNLSKPPVWFTLPREREVSHLMGFPTSDDLAVSKLLGVPTRKQDDTLVMKQLRVFFHIGTGV